MPDKKQIVPIITVAAILVLLSIVILVIAPKLAEPQSDGDDYYNSFDTPSSFSDAGDAGAEIVPLGGWKTAEAAAGAELHAEPSADSQVVRQLADGCSGTIDAVAGRWFRFTSGAYSGWISSDSVTPGEELVPFTPSIAGMVTDLGTTGSRQSFDYVSKHYKCTGVSIAVIENGEVRYTYQYGSADKAGGVAVTAQTAFRSADISQLPVAMAALSMQESGALSLTDDLSSLAGFTAANPRYPKVALTLQQLLTHTSSLKDDIDYSSPLSELLAAKGSYRAATPGKSAAYLYSKPGVAAAASLLEQRVGMTMADYTRQWLFEPLGLKASYVAGSLSASDIAVMYNAKGRVSLTVAEQQAADYSGTPGSDRRLYTESLTASASDLAKLLCVLIGDGSYDGHYYLSPESVAALENAYLEHKPFKQCLVLRQRENNYGGRTLLYLSGSSKGMLGYISYDPEGDDGVVVLTTGCSNTKLYNGTYTVCAEFAKLCYKNVIAN